MANLKRDSFARVKASSKQKYYTVYISSIPTQGYPNFVIFCLLIQTFFSLLLVVP